MRRLWSGVNIASRKVATGGIELCQGIKERNGRGRVLCMVGPSVLGDTKESFVAQD